MSFSTLREGQTLQDSSSSTLTTEKIKKKTSEPIVKTSTLAPQKHAKPSVNNNEVPPPWVIDAVDESVASGENSNVTNEDVTNKDVTNKYSQSLKKHGKGGGCASSSESSSYTRKTSKNTVNTAQQERKSKEATPAPTATSNTPRQIKATSRLAWHDIIPQLKLTGRAAELIKHCLLESNENGIVSLALEGSNQDLLSNSVEAEVQSALTGFYGNSVKLKLSLLETNKAQAEHSEHKKQDETPAKRTQRLSDELQQQAEQNIATDPFVIELQNRFGAQIVPGSVSPK